MPADAFTAIAPIYDQVMARVPYDDWVEYVELLTRHWRASRAPGIAGHRVLDLACGTGTVGLELARRGHQVVGVDRSWPMLRVGRQKAAGEGLPMAWCCQDMRALGLAGAFDVVVCLFDSVNYILDLDGVGAAFAGVRRTIAEEGLFIFDVNTEVALEQELFTQEELEPDAPVKLRWDSRYDRRSRTTEVDMTFYLEDGQVVKELHRQRAHSPRELRDTLTAAGFRTLAVYDAYTFNLPRRDSDRVFYVCRPAPVRP